MKRHDFDRKLIASRPDAYRANQRFTDSVMKKINTNEIFSPAIRSMNVTNKETFMMKLKHLPTFALIAIGIGIVALLGGTTYAVVKTVEHLNNLQVNETSTNEFGRQQLNVTYNGCSDSENDVTYELKRGGNLSAEDGAKTLQARCDMAAIEAWFRTNEPSAYGSSFILESADTVTAVDATSLTLQRAGKQEIKSDTKLLSNGSIIALNDIKVGDVVFVYPGSFMPFDKSLEAMPLHIFKLSQAPEYYGLDFQSYVNERGPCPGNATRTCLQASNINHTVLIIGYGGGYGDPRLGTAGFKQVQGRVLDYNDSSITLDVGNGVQYTLNTAKNVIDYYNQNTVQRLAKIDSIYAQTQPSELMVRKGDSLEITYLGEESDTSNSLKWEDIISIQLMVERIPNNLEVLRKY